MTIKNREAFMDAVWDYAPIDEMLPGKCRCSDIDGVINIRDITLFMEQKPTGKELSLGQTILFEHLSSVPGQACVCWWGDPKTWTITKIRIFQHGKQETIPIRMVSGKTALLEIIGQFLEGGLTDE